MKRRSTKISSQASRKGRRVRKKMEAARLFANIARVARDYKTDAYHIKTPIVEIKPDQSREDWARENNVDLAWSDKWGRAYRRALPNPWLK